MGGSAAAFVVTAGVGGRCCTQGCNLGQQGPSDEEPPIEMMQSSVDAVEVAIPSQAVFSRPHGETSLASGFPGLGPGLGPLPPLRLALQTRAALADVFTPRGEAGGEFGLQSPRAQQKQRDGAAAGLCAASYQGSFLGSDMHGWGKLRIQDYTYIGGFHHNRKHGDGTMLWDDGRKYSGQFVNGLFSGHAVMTWPDGRAYRGQYREDRKHGQGTFLWKDGRRYEGEWVDGQRHGVGLYTNAKGLTRRGTWELDCPVSWEPAPPGAEAAPRPRPKLGVL